MIPHFYVCQALVFLALPLSVIGQTANTVRPPLPPEFLSKTTFQDCLECPEMVMIPPGAFRMGSPTSEPGRYDEEGPQRIVNVRRFAAARFDVTRGQWTSYLRASERASVKGCDYSLLPKEMEVNASWINLGFAQDDTHPVVCVSWSDAHDYVLWLSQKSGHKYVY